MEKLKGSHLANIEIFENLKETFYALHDDFKFDLKKQP
jgi:hypothetical protein